MSLLKAENSYVVYGADARAGTYTQNRSLALGILLLRKDGIKKQYINMTPTEFQEYHIISNLNSLNPGDEKIEFSDMHKNNIIASIKRVKNITRLNTEVLTVALYIYYFSTEGTKLEYDKVREYLNSGGSKYNNYLSMLASLEMYDGKDEMKIARISMDIIRYLNVVQ